MDVNIAIAEKLNAFNKAKTADGLFAMYLLDYAARNGDFPDIEDLSAMLAFMMASLRLSSADNPEGRREIDNIIQKMLGGLDL